MRHLKKLLFVGIGVLTTIAPAAYAAPDRTATIAAGTSFTWTGNDQAAVNLTGVSVSGVYDQSQTCSKAPASYCETTLLKFVNPVPDFDADGRLLRQATIRIEANLPVADFDVQVYESNVEGTKGRAVAGAYQLAIESTTEEIAITVETTRTAPAKYYLVDVIYFATAGGYDGTASF